MLAPLENKNAVGLQYPHALPKTVVNHLRPILAEFTVLFDEPRGFFCSGEVRRVEHNERERVVLKRQRGEIADDIGIYNALSLRHSVAAFPYIRQAFGPLVAVDGGRVIFVEPYSPRAAGRVEDFLLGNVEPFNAHFLLSFTVILNF